MKRNSTAAIDLDRDTMFKPSRNTRGSDKRQCLVADRTTASKEVMLDVSVEVQVEQDSDSGDDLMMAVVDADIVHVECEADDDLSADEAISSRVATVLWSRQCADGRYEHEVCYHTNPAESMRRSSQPSTQWVSDGYLVGSGLRAQAAVTRRRYDHNLRIEAARAEMDAADARFEAAREAEMDAEEAQCDQVLQQYAQAAACAAKLPDRESNAHAISDSCIPSQRAQTRRPHMEVALHQLQVHARCSTALASTADEANVDDAALDAIIATIVSDDKGIAAAPIRTFEPDTATSPPSAMSSSIHDLPSDAVGACMSVATEVSAFTPMMFLVHSAISSPGNGTAAALCLPAPASISAVDSALATAARAIAHVAGARAAPVSVAVAPADDSDTDVATENETDTDLDTEYGDVNTDAPVDAAHTKVDTVAVDVEYLESASTNVIDPESCAATAGVAPGTSTTVPLLPATPSFCTTDSYAVDADAIATDAEQADVNVGGAMELTAVPHLLATASVSADAEALDEGVTEVQAEDAMEADAAEVDDADTNFTATSLDIVAAVAAPVASLMHCPSDTQTAASSHMAVARVTRARARADARNTINNTPLYRRVSVGECGGCASSVHVRGEDVLHAHTDFPVCKGFDLPGIDLEFDAVMNATITASIQNANEQTDGSTNAPMDYDDEDEDVSKKGSLRPRFRNWCITNFNMTKEYHDSRLLHLSLTKYWIQRPEICTTTRKERIHYHVQFLKPRRVAAVTKLFPGCRLEFLPHTSTARKADRSYRTEISDDAGTWTESKDPAHGFLRCKFDAMSEAADRTDSSEIYQMCQMCQGAVMHSTMGASPSCARPAPSAPLRLYATGPSLTAGQHVPIQDDAEEFIASATAAASSGGENMKTKIERIRQALGLENASAAVVLKLANETMVLLPIGNLVQQADAMLVCLFGNTAR